ncbi:hypothetical protein GEMRC1_002710 [Eukaryota sp. GEM-RC1]
MLSNFPDNKELLTMYSLYLREVLLDSTGADYILEQLDLQSSVGSSNEGSIALSSAPSRASVRQKRKKARRRQGIEMVDSRDSDISVNYVNKLSKMTITSLLFLVALLFISFIIYFASLSDLTNRIQVLLESSHILVVANKLALDARMFGVHLRWSGARVRASYYDSLREDAEHLNFHASRVFIGNDAFSVPHSFICPRTGDVEVRGVDDAIITEFLRNPSLVVSFYRNTNPALTDLKLLNYWELILSFSNAVFEFIHDLTDSRVNINRYFRFLSDNRSSINLASFQFWHLLLTASEQFFNQSRLASILSLAFSILCVLFIGIFGFYRIISRISLERQAVLNLFLLVPRSVCSQIVQDLKAKTKRKASKDDYSDQESDFEQDDESIDQSVGLFDLMSRQLIQQVKHSKIL